MTLHSLSAIALVALASAADISWVDCAENVPSSLAGTTLPDTLPATLACGRLDVPLDHSKDLSDDNVITLGPETEDEYRDFALHVGTYAQSCIDQSSPPSIVEHLATGDIIRDWNLVREALGGTYLGEHYAALYPEHTGRFALDAIFATGVSNHDLLAAQYKSTQNMIYRADAACLAEPSCPFNYQGKGSVPKAFDEVLALASNGSAPVSVHDVREQVALNYFIGQPRLNDFNAALGQALNGNWTGWDYASTGAALTNVEDNSFEGWSSLRESLKEADTANVNFVFFQVMHLICSSWPYTASSNEKLSVNASMVLVTADWDLVTPTDLATFEWQQTPKSVLIDRHGDAHGTFNVPGPARDAFVNFLVTGDLPSALDDPKVAIYLPGSTRGESPDPYSVPTGLEYGDTV
ncbi:hypothetical protein CYLTODRAFT_456861 [Cylindrobasidium torrendii FP15055 ss-10]|uniref:Peptidase S33 tripeptidyl aminopeptidase-like C-terminal domain-containing protein n=1 Tax=Cylindrobasidium torrendii FP15055 ss-10 TaxID=1314674 RepID=A0A0D7B2W8_9AGAR|nr:hypothetical protein CYLTODRAFT_456861 [Cylindrobasidium torrendii FP15055 ss-10]